MSVTGRQLLANTTIGNIAATEEWVAGYITEFLYSPPFGGQVGATVQTKIEDYTESTFNLYIQQAIADRANLETENIEVFVEADVFGGRI